MIRKLLLLIALCSHTALAADSAPVSLTPEQEIAAIALANSRGLAIYRHDVAAARATDAALAVGSFKQDGRVKGWVTEEIQGGIQVTFIDQTPAALYRVTVSNTDGRAGIVSVLNTPIALTAFESAAASARAVALTAPIQRCAANYNSVVLPAGESGTKNWQAYLLPAMTKPHVVPLGGSYRIETDGAKIVSQRGFTRSCVTLGGDPDAVALVVTHLLDPVPTEVHVFWSLWAKKPIYVSTAHNNLTWLVDGNSIRIVDQPGK